MNILTAARRATLGAILVASATLTPAFAADAHEPATCSTDIAAFQKAITDGGYHIVASGTAHDGNNILLAMGGQGLWVLLAKNDQGICVLSYGRGALAVSIPGSPA